MECKCIDIGGRKFLSAGHIAIPVDMICGIESHKDAYREGYYVVRIYLSDGREFPYNDENANDLHAFLNGE